MHRFQDIQSALLSDDEPNMKSQIFSQALNDQDMESTFKPKEEAVSNDTVDNSSSRRNTKKPHVCDTCCKSFSRKDNLKQHMLIHSGEKPFVCLICEKPFARKSDFNRHKLSHSKIPTQHKCDQCSDIFSRKIDLLKHRKIHKSPKQHNCNQCNEVFPRKFDLLTHRKSHSKPSIMHKCEKCNEVFSRKYELLKHKKIHKCPKQYKCRDCNEVFSRKSDLLHHVRTFHPVIPKQRDPALKDELFDKVKHFKRRNALNVFSKTTIMANEENDKDFHVFFDSIRSDLLNELNYQMEVKKRMKWYTIIQVLVSRIKQEGDIEITSAHFHSKTILELVKENIPTHIEEAFAKMINSFEKFTQRGSGWTLEKVVKLEVSSAKYTIS